MEVDQSATEDTGSRGHASERVPRKARRALGFLLASLLCLGSWAEEQDRPEASEALTSDRIDGVHRDLPAELAPIEQGVILIQLHSSEPVLEVESHQLLLWPLGEGSHGARLTARFQGEAKLEADIEIAGLPARISDFVELPEQDTSIEGRFRIDREEGGYRVLAEELPRFIELRVESRLAGQIVTVCRGMALLAPGGGAECEGLEKMLSLLRLPMPEAGDTYFIEESKLTSFERDQLDGYLSRH